jgi:transmembrane sensor
LQQTEYRTRPGERQQETLADGSQVELASNSDVVVRYRANERLITLKYGAALFRVAKNPNRPFIVQAALTRVRAVGTVFNVESGAQGVSVTVVEGRVSLSQQSATRFAASGDDITRPIITLGANEQVSISRAGVASTSHRDASDSAAPWIADQISFDNETVAEVSRRFNLRNTVNIEIQDPVLAARRISGMFRANDPQSFVAFIHAAAHAEVMQPDSTHIILVPEDNDNQRR